MDKSKVICRCKRELTDHIYATSEDSGEEGYLCLSCSRFKPFDDEGEFDAQKNAERELNAEKELHCRHKEVSVVYAAEEKGYSKGLEKVLLVQCTICEEVLYKLQAKGRSIHNLLP